MLQVEVSPPSTIRAGSQGGERQDRNIKQHSSAPERCFNLSKELRSSKSAPDLTLPALAAIRGLQNGTLQVDRHTRMKIAAAAKRVLEARELKRRSSQEREPQIVYPYPAPDPVSPLGRPLDADCCSMLSNQNLKVMCSISQYQSTTIPGKVVVTLVGGLGRRSTMFLFLQLYRARYFGIHLVKTPPLQSPSCQSQGESCF